MRKQPNLTERQVAEAKYYAERGLLLGQTKTEQRLVAKGKNAHRLELLLKQKRQRDHLDRETIPHFCVVCGKWFDKERDRKAHMVLKHPHWDENDDVLGLPLKGTLAWAIMTDNLRK